MTASDQIKILREELEKYLQKIKLPAQSEMPKIPKVYAFKIPSPNVLDANLYPMVFLEFAGIEDDAQQATLSILITVGVYATENSGDGATDNLNLTEAVREFLLTHKLIGYGILQYPVTAVPVESDAVNFNFSEIFCQYKMQKLENNYLEY